MKKQLILVFLISLLAVASCGRKARIRENPLLAPWEGLYGLPPFSNIEGEDYMPALDEALKQHASQIKDIKDEREEPTFENVILPLDNSGGLLKRVTSLMELMAAVESGSDFGAMEEEFAIKIAEHACGIMQDNTLFTRVKTVYDLRNEYDLDPLQRRLTERVYNMFVDGGALLANQDKTELRRINAELAKYQTAFGRNLTRASKESCLLADSSEIAGLPYAIRDTTKKAAVAAGADSLFLFLLDPALVMPVLTLSPNAGLRERLYNAFRSRCEENNGNDNNLLVKDIAGLRERKAQLLGFGSYAEYATVHGGLVENGAAVYDLLDRIWKPALEGAERERELWQQQILNRDPETVRACDVLYYSDRLAKAETGMDGVQMEVFFPLGNVRIGAFELANRLWGLTFRPVQPDLYNPDCEAFEVFDIDGSLMGLLVLDCYSRPAKRPGVGIYPLNYHPLEGESRIVPAVCMVLNFNRPPNSSRPTLLSLRETEAFFRATGNSIARLFVDIPYQGLQEPDKDISGMAGELMACWAFQPRMLGRYAMHFSSGKLPSTKELEHIANASSLDAGSRTASETATAYLDMDIYSPEYTFVNPDIFELEYLREKRGMPSFIDPAYRLSTLGESFARDAGARYYEHILYRVMAADIFGRFAASIDLFDRRIAQELRDKVLSKGGGSSASDLYVDFMGRGPDPEAFLVAKGFIDPPPQPVETPVVDLLAVDGEVANDEDMNEQNITGDEIPGVKRSGR